MLRTLTSNRRRALKRLLAHRTRLFTNYLRIRYERPWTIFLAMLFPFLQAFLASIIVIFTNPNDNSLTTNLQLFGVAALYYVAFAMNSKRATRGSWLGLILLITFGGLGIVCGKLFSIYYL